MDIAFRQVCVESRTFNIRELILWYEGTILQPNVWFVVFHLFGFMPLVSPPVPLGQ